MDILPEMNSRELGRAIMLIIIIISFIALSGAGIEVPDELKIAFTTAVGYLVGLNASPLRGDNGDTSGTN